jgi:hypothetical protein
MNAFTASVVLSAVMICGAQAMADEAATPPALVDVHATHKKLMQECLEKQRSQNGTAALGNTSNTRKLCAIRVRTQMQQLKDAATVPLANEPQSPAANRQ